MIDRGTFALAELRLQHRHADGTWSDLAPQPAHHDPVDHDQERDWASGTIFRCECGEEIRVEVPEDVAEPGT
jgi:hypothetical protein